MDILLIGDEFADLHGLHNIYNEFKSYMSNNCEDNILLQTINKLQAFLNYPQQSIYDFELILSEFLKLGTCLTYYRNGDFDKINDFLKKNDMTYNKLIQLFTVIVNCFPDNEVDYLLHDFKFIKNNLYDFCVTKKINILKTKQLDIIKNLNEKYVINCDYFNLYHRLYNKCNKQCYLNFNIKNNDIVLGIMEEPDILKDYYLFYKQYQRLDLNLINDYNELLSKVNNSINTQYIIHIFGYTFNQFDHNLLNPLFIMNNVKLYIYYKKGRFNEIYNRVEKWFNLEDITLLTVGPNEKIKFLCID